MQSYPTTLPPPIATGIKLNLPASTGGTDMDAGNRRVRRQFTTVPDMQDVAWRFTAAEYEVFRQWNKRDLSSGAAWFSVDLIDGYGSVSSTTARFATAPKFSIRSGLGRDVTATLELIPALVLSGSDVAPFSDISPDDLMAADMILQRIVNVSMPTYL